MNETVLEGRKLEDKDRGGTSDPYCVVTLLAEGEYDTFFHGKNRPKHNFQQTFPKRKNVYKTKVIQKTLNPVWHEETFSL